MRGSRLLFLISAAAAAVIGLMAGAVYPQSTNAASLAEFWFKIPVRPATAADALLSCDWHAGPCGGY